MNIDDAIKGLALRLRLPWKQRAAQRTTIPIRFMRTFPRLTELEAP